MNLLKKKFESFNLNTKIIDGHNFEQIKQEIQIAKTQDKTTILVCNTIKGKDIFFAENKAIWAYKILDQDHYEKAVKFLKTK